MHSVRCSKITGQELSISLEDLAGLMFLSVSVAQTPASSINVFIYDFDTFSGADPGFVERGAQRLPRAPQARRFLEGPV